MKDIELVLGLLAVMIMLVALARKLQVSYPILLVLAGLVMGFVPGLPKIELQPELVFILFLPPILQYAAYLTPTRDFRASIRSIGLLAVGLVLATMGAVALVAHLIIPGLPWAAAFVLGAIVAPPDAVAASAIAQRLQLPRRIVTVLEGESLLNDATALVAYRAALVAVTSGTFSLLEAGGNFLLAAGGGVAVGIVSGLVLIPIFRRLNNDVSVYITLTFLSGYATYILADQVFKVSGVLAVIALGLLHSQPRFNTMTAELRVQAFPIWDIVIFLLNGLIFILIGLQLRSVVERLDGETFTLIWYAFAICLTVIVVRIAWVFPGTYLPRLPKRTREHDPFPPWQHAVIVAWTGMRGIVSLASALAIPVVISEGGPPFPQRDLIIFLTFCVILATLVVQGLTLPLIIKVLKVVDDGGGEREEDKARLVAARAGKDRLHQLAQNDGISTEMVEKMGRQYEARIRRFAARYHGDQDGETEAHFSQFQRLELDLLDVELAAVIDLRNNGVINDEVLRRVQHDLDLERVRIQ